MTNSEIRSRTITFVKENFFGFIKGVVPLLLIQLLMIGIMGTGIYQFFSAFTPTMDGTMFPDFDVTVGIPSLILLGVSWIIAGLVGAFLAYGYNVYILRMLRHGEKRMGHTLSGFSRQGLRFLGVSLLIGLIVGLVMAVIGVIFERLDMPLIEEILTAIISLILTTVTWVIPFLIHDHPEVNFIGIIKGAWDETKGNRIRYLLLFIPAMIVFFVLMVTLITVGIFTIGAPMMQTGSAVGLNVGLIIAFAIIFFLLNVFMTFYFLALSVMFYEKIINKGEDDWMEEPYVNPFREEENWYDEDEIIE